jgi:glycosyltransferase involved in cell wall biosynthesis
MKKVSIIIPCHNEQDNIQKIYSALTDIFKICPAYEFEILMIDDGSIDNTLDEIKKISEKDKQVFYISLSRNFGKENAMLAGFDNVSGDCTIIMDADMQHPPTLIPDMLKLWKKDMMTSMPNASTEEKKVYSVRNCHYFIIAY